MSPWLRVLAVLSYSGRPRRRHRQALVARDVSIKSAEDIAMARGAGGLAAEVLEMIAPHVVPGVSTETLDRICHDHIVNVQGAVPANVGYLGYPKTILT